MALCVLEKIYHVESHCIDGECQRKFVEIHIDWYKWNIMNNNDEA